MEAGPKRESFLMVSILSWALAVRTVPIDLTVKSHFLCIHTDRVKLPTPPLSEPSGGLRQQDPLPLPQAHFLTLVLKVRPAFLMPHLRIPADDFCLCVTNYFPFICFDYFLSDVYASLGNPPSRKVTYK